ncbi:MAG: hypothetical protein IPK82_03575 [Polyangiaceae bacterium]|nr:hypothetical protein [Polyangiaceae bacterium]
MAARKNLALSVWTGAPSAGQIKTFYRHSERFVHAHPAGQILCSIVLRGTPDFSQETRTELAKMVKDHKLFSLGSAHLILLSGLAGTAVRTFLNTVVLIAKPTAPFRVFAEKGAAVVWLHTQLSKAPEAWLNNEIREAIDEAMADR